NNSLFSAGLKGYAAKKSDRKHRYSLNGCFIRQSDFSFRQTLMDSKLLHYIPPSCASPSVLCPGSSICIKPTQMCDGKRDCPDGSDEKCVKRSDFRCKDRRSCIPKSQVCDGRSQCNDGSDELNCPSTVPTAPNKVLKCRYGSKPCRDDQRCIFLEHFCDGEKDCQDGSDEEGCVPGPPLGFEECPEMVAMNAFCIVKDLFRLVV
uniref:Uncharacterized protein n=1 Tax=Cyprinodon variegatus TaxID=28743 RepID=A0A3Q2FUH6_CYPVA